MNVAGLEGFLFFDGWSFGFACLLFKDWKSGLDYKYLFQIAKTVK